MEIILAIVILIVSFGLQYMIDEGNKLKQEESEQKKQRWIYQGKLNRICKNVDSLLVGALGERGVVVQDLFLIKHETLSEYPAEKDIIGVEALYVNSKDNNFYHSKIKLMSDDFGNERINPYGIKSYLDEHLVTLEEEVIFSKNFLALREVKQEFKNILFYFDDDIYELKDKDKKTLENMVDFYKKVLK